MNETLRRFCALTLARTGLALRESDLSAAQTALAARGKALRLDREAYLRLLDESTPQTEREWSQLMPHLTNGESYFFRDAGQIALLRDQILPQLIARQAAQPAGNRSLRLWSAGCSSGEEPYSLAMLLDALLPEGTRAGWRISVLGTDINEQAIERARRGVYRAWSLRAVEPALRDRYFRETAQGWQISTRIRSMVTFEVGNLRADTAHRAGEKDATNLILCRNVLIYFDRAAVAEVVRKFAAALHPGGYLLTGHAELHPQDLGVLRPRLLTGSVVYERPLEGVASSVVSAATSTPRAEPHSSVRAPQPFTAQRPTPMLPERMVSHESGNPARRQVPAPLVPASLAPLPLSPPVTPANAVVPTDGAALLREAGQHADAGRYEAATALCERIIAQHAWGAAPYLLLARIAEERGETDGALSLLKKAIYLAPDCTVAYLELGDLYAGRGDEARARQMRQVALEHLEATVANSPASATVPLTFEIPEAERPALIERLQALLAPDASFRARSLAGTRGS